MLDRCYKPSAAPSLEARGFDNGRAAPDGDLDSRGGIGTCGECFVDVDDSYSRWLVVLTDTADFQCFDDKGRVDKQAPARAETAVEGVLASMQALTGLNFVIIDASGIANFNAKHSMWPTWRRMSHRLTDEVGEFNNGLNIQAANVSEIDEAFEKVAGAMTGGASG